ncbi:conserved hypothetical protein [Deferribacter desulfuricans SSM1]|uniref:histidine kinase n=1 Tax=Deferribacter desulfuricans (strain DSM 14783 / JCM 11476 / NBRC 101012 / SSM1) TaxID=639282 RepID=D3PDA8_DEFDS|nr:PAS domain-containing sensor histidine kinase [Deferribacter desulfuricans]BAI80581.1 conserved hypothetical protein [Deferribacter desulfuricans SSM1]
MIKTKNSKVSGSIFNLTLINNIILLIRLVIFYLIFLFTYFSNQVNFIVNELIILAIFIAFMTLIVFIMNYTLDSKHVLIFQSLFDTFLITYLMYRTNFLDSPYIIFFAFIIGYLSFVFGYKLGILGLLEFIFSSFVLLYIFQADKNINFTYLSYQFQYIFAFLLIYILTSYLHFLYKKRLREYEELHDIHELIVKNIGIGITLLDNNNKIVSLNDAGKKILGINERIVGKSLKQFGFDISEDKREDILEFNNKFIGYRVQDFTNESNKKVGKLLIFQDVTEKENLKIELERKQKLANLGQFSTIVAHEIKNPLGAIKGSIQIIKKQIPNKKLVDILEREINKLDMILNNLLYFSKPAKKSKEYIYICDFIDSFINYFRINELFEELTFDLDLQENYKILITELELRQIFWNLIINSYEVKNDAKIAIKTFSDDKYNYLIYTDNGPGISDEILENVLKPFYSTKKNGTGLGLYIISEICKKNNIMFKLYSNSEFTGFKIEFKTEKLF